MEADACTLIMGLSINASRAQLEKMGELMFETFEVPVSHARWAGHV